MKQISIVLGVIFLITIGFFLFRSTYPSQYDCLKLGSDTARGACLNKYFPIPTPISFLIQYLSVVENELNGSTLIVTIKNDAPKPANNVVVKIDVCEDKICKSFIDTKVFILGGVAWANSTTKLTYPFANLPFGRWYITKIVSAQEF